MIKYVYEIDYPPRGKDKYLKWVRSIADALQAPAELRRLASYDNVYSMTPHRVVEFTFDSPQDAATYFDRKEIGLILQDELPTHSANIRIKVLALRDDYIKATVADPAGHQDEPLVPITRLAAGFPPVGRFWLLHGLDVVALRRIGRSSRPSGTSSGRVSRSRPGWLRRPDRRPRAAP